MKEEDDHGSKNKDKMVVEEDSFSDDGGSDEECGFDFLEEEKAFSIDDPILPKSSKSELERDLKLAIVNSLLDFNSNAAAASSSSSSGNNLSIGHRQADISVENLDTDQSEGDSESSDDSDFELFIIRFSPKKKNRTQKPCLGLKRKRTPSPRSPLNFVVQNVQSCNNNINNDYSNIPISNSSNSDSSHFDCEICVETKSESERFSIKGCKHAYCGTCVINYVGAKLQENISDISCLVPSCSGLLDPEHCRSAISARMFSRWGISLCKAAIPHHEKFYCPYRDCSALMIGDDSEGKKKKMVVGQLECPHCKRMFCVHCKVPWHDSLTCEEFQKINNEDGIAKEDGMLMELADNKQWKRCPSCNFFVEKARGCTNVKCRCGTGFCYRCGNQIRRGMQRACPYCKLHY